MNKKIAIVGGGPGGLTLARLLQMNGAKVTVYERDESRNVRVQGATLDLHEESGLKALQTAGLMEAFRANYRPGADKLVIVDRSAEIRYQELEAAEKWMRPEIDRGPLRDILLDSLEPGTVVWDSHFLSLTPEGEGFSISFRDGRSVYADLVIGADGANSKIRPYLTAIQPFYSGVTAVEGAVYDSEKNSPAIHQLLNGGKIFAIDDAKTLIVSSKGDGSLAFYMGVNTDEFWYRDSGIDFSDRAQVLGWFKKVFAGWGDIWEELFDRSNPMYFPRPLYCMPFDQEWDALPNLTMLGDAAHLMPPYAGEGVNMAMLDALELAECLVGKHLSGDGSSGFFFSDTRSAIAAYEKKMLTRAGETARMTMEQTAVLHSNQGLAHMIGMFTPPGE